MGHDKGTGRPERPKFQFWGKDPWPNAIVEAVALVASAEDTPVRPAELAWQAALRIRSGDPVPPGLQAWFNRYVVDGGRVPQRPPGQQENDRLGVAYLQSRDGCGKTEAIRLVASASGREFNAVETNVNRHLYKKK